MRKLILVAGLLCGAALLSGSSAKAEAMLGCECISLGQPAMCTATVLECTAHAGLCLAPCSYEPPKAVKHHRHHKKKKKM
jgi:hypothetical protein